ncbi:hypothetical protein BB170200_05457 [Mycobacterium marinum]|nr:hypothetical protein BB170200_05457 [Mycobacterium marinum]
MHAEVTINTSGPMGAIPTHPVRIIDVEMQLFVLMHQFMKFQHGRDITVHGIDAVDQVPDFAALVAKFLQLVLEHVEIAMPNHLDRNAFSSRNIRRVLHTEVDALIEDYRIVGRKKRRQDGDMTGGGGRIDQDGFVVIDFAQVVL